MTYVCMNDFRDAADLTLVIREESVTDVSARERLLDVAFGPSRFAKTCERLREGRAPARGLALVARSNGKVVGTIRLWHVATESGHAALLLGPVAVACSHQSLGIGASLIRDALRRAKDRGHRAVILVGDAPYYQRFGFERRLTRDLDMPGFVDPERFLALELVPGALDGAAGLLRPTGPAAPRWSVQSEPKLRRAA